MTASALTSEQVAALLATVTGARDRIQSISSALVSAACAPSPAAQAGAEYAGPAEVARQIRRQCLTLQGLAEEKQRLLFLANDILLILKARKATASSDPSCPADPALEQLHHALRMQLPVMIHGVCSAFRHERGGAEAASADTGRIARLVGHWGEKGVLDALSCAMCTRAITEYVPPPPSPTSNAARCMSAPVVPPHYSAQQSAMGYPGWHLPAATANPHAAAPSAYAGYTSYGAVAAGLPEASAGPAGYTPVQYATGSLASASAPSPHPGAPLSHVPQSTGSSYPGAVGCSQAWAHYAHQSVSYGFPQPPAATSEHSFAPADHRAAGSALDSHGHYGWGSSVASAAAPAPVGYAGVAAPETGSTVPRGSEHQAFQAPQQQQQQGSLRWDQAAGPTPSTPWAASAVYGAAHEQARPHHAAAPSSDAPSSLLSQSAQHSHWAQQRPAGAAALPTAAPAGSAAGYGPWTGHAPSGYAAGGQGYTYGAAYDHGGNGAGASGLGAPATYGELQQGHYQTASWPAAAAAPVYSASLGATTVHPTDAPSFPWARSAAPAAPAASSLASGVDAAPLPVAAVLAERMRRTPLHQNLEAMPVGMMVTVVKAALAAQVAQHAAASAAGIAAALPVPYTPFDPAALPAARTPVVEPGRLRARVDDYYRKLDGLRRLLGLVEEAQRPRPQQGQGQQQDATATAGVGGDGASRGVSRSRSRSRSPRDGSRGGRRERSRSRDRFGDRGRGGGLGVSREERWRDGGGRPRGARDRRQLPEGAGLGYGGGAGAEGDDDTSQQASRDLSSAGLGLTAEASAGHEPARAERGARSGRPPPAGKGASEGGWKGSPYYPTSWQDAIARRLAAAAPSE